MQSQTTIPLDDATINHLLSSLPDYATLLAFRLTCKTVNAVFKRYRTSIQRAIAENFTGPSYRQALLIVRAVPHVSTYGTNNDEGHLPCDAGKLIFAEQGTELDRELSHLEMHTIVKNARIVRGLEDLFSQW
jgi:hypothetical protein